MSMDSICLEKEAFLFILLDPIHIEDEILDVAKEN